MKDEEQIDIIFPDGLLFRGYVRLLSVPYAKHHYPLVRGDLLAYNGLDAEAEVAANFRAMSWDDRVKALHELPWSREIAAWLMPPDHRCTIADLVSRTGDDLDLDARPFTYTEEDWAKAWFRVEFSAWFSRDDRAEWDRLRWLTREEQIDQLNAWHPGEGDLCRDLKPYSGLDSVTEMLSLRWQEQIKWPERQLAVSFP